MDTINLSVTDYNSQRDNKLFASSACMPTARVMFYKGNGFVINNPTDMADDDYITSLLNTEEAKEFCLKKYPWSKGIPPREVHGMYNSYVDEKVIGKRVSDFKTDMTYSDFVNLIVFKKQVIMTSGVFTSAGIFGHAYCIIGFNHEMDELIIADPWGDYRTLFKDERGYGILMSYGDFIRHNRVPNEMNKWGHIVV